MATGLLTGNLKERVKQLALEMGFDLVGIASAQEFSEAEVVVERVRQGLMDGLPWFTEDRVRLACSPQRLLPGAKSIICVGMSYLPVIDHSTDGALGPRGKAARYARGQDYHYVMKRRLRALAQRLSQELEQPVKARIFVDDGPMLDRAAAARAGVGWYGKNTNILTQSHGSWVFLGEIVTDLDIEPDDPLKKSCGKCTLCIEACPTDAIVAPYVLDNRRCISYLTIENRCPILCELRPQVGAWVFGCDICQEVCPVNRKAKPTREAAFSERVAASNAANLLSLLAMTEEEFRQRFRDSPLRRAKRAGLQRNACVALGNSGDPAAVSHLARALRDEEPLVRQHAAWALGRISGPEAKAALLEALQTEADGSVLEEVRRALDEVQAR